MNAPFNTDMNTLFDNWNVRTRASLQRCHHRIGRLAGFSPWGCPQRLKPVPWRTLMRHAWRRALIRIFPYTNPFP